MRLAIVLCCAHLCRIAAQFDDFACPPSTAPLVMQAQAYNQLLLTPGFIAGAYPANADCHYIIKAGSAAQQVQLTVANSGLETRLFTDCDDFVRVYDGAILNSSRLLAEWCGQGPPAELSSSQTSLYLHFHSDAATQARGVNMTFTQYDVPGCAVGWQLVSGGCTRLYPKLSTWPQAQQQCLLMHANLATVHNNTAYVQLYDTYLWRLQQLPDGSLPWLGYLDAAEEGSVRTYDGRNPTWPQPFPSLARNADALDCVHWTLDDLNAFDIDDCRHRRSFVCYRPPDALTQQAANASALLVVAAGLTASVQWTLLQFWPFLLALVLLLLMCLTACYMKQPKRRTNSIEPLVDAEDGAGSKQHSAGRQAVSTVNREMGVVNREVRQQQDAMSSSEQQRLPAIEPLPLPLQQAPAARQPPERTGIRTVPGSAHSTDIAVERERQLDEYQAPQGICIPRPKITQHQLQYRPQSLAVERDAGFEVYMSTGGLAEVHGLAAAAGNQTHSVAPLDHWQRPQVRVLDNVSAISLDEFWSKLEQGRRPSVASSITQRTPALNSKRTAM